LGVSTPTFIGAFCAIDGIGKAAAPVAAAVPTMNFRRLSRKAISSSLWRGGTRTAFFTPALDVPVCPLARRW
jgi:hypothetical protein